MWIKEINSSLRYLAQVQLTNVASICKQTADTLPKCKQKVEDPDYKQIAVVFAKVKKERDVFQKCKQTVFIFKNVNI